MFCFPPVCWGFPSKAFVLLCMLPDVTASQKRQKNIKICGLLLFFWSCSWTDDLVIKFSIPQSTSNLLLWAQKSFFAPTRSTNQDQNHWENTIDIPVATRWVWSPCFPLWKLSVRSKPKKPKKRNARLGSKEEYWFGDVNLWPRLCIYSCSVYSTTFLHSLLSSIKLVCFQIKGQLFARDQLKQRLHTSINPQKLATKVLT